MTDSLTRDLAEIEQRAQSTGLAVERRDSTELGTSVRLGFDESGLRWPPWFSVSTTEEAEALLATSFEHFRLIPRYDALLDLRDGNIEARITGRMRLLADKPQDGRVHVGYRMSAYGGQGEMSIALDRAGDLLILLGEWRRRAGIIRRDADPKLSVVRFDGFGVKDTGGARDLLEGLGASVLFELDLTHELGARFALARRRLTKKPAHRPQTSPHLPGFPRNKYEPEPLQLYMYAREAMAMPLLEFLAYYQAIEFFFPRYSESALRRRVEKLVKHPGFSAHNDRDIGTLVEILREARGRGFGSELDQLKETLRECIEPKELSDFIAADEERAQFFRDKRSPLTAATVPLQDGAMDLRDRVACRIYDLRCKIVHAKDPGHERVDLLLPNSPEAQLIGHDIALVRLLAERVITASASPLSL
jgi:hypothetical protein